jgi:hypothetical protein
MTIQKRTAVEQLDALLDSFLEEWQELSADAIRLAPENEAIQSSIFRKIKSAAYVEAGKRRLARARQAVSTKSQAPSSRQPIDLAEARRYLSQAANDARITLAARDLRDLPDDEVERLYWQLKELEAVLSSRKL